MALLLCVVCFVIAFLIVCSNYEEMAVIPFFYKRRFTHIGNRKCF